MDSTVFLADDRSGTLLRYKEFFATSEGKSFSFAEHIKRDSLAGVVSDIFASLCCDVPVTLYDDDLSEEEIVRLSGSSGNRFEPVAHRILHHVTDASDFLQISSKLIHWSITLFTSGTTGLPKKVKHTFNSLTRAVKTGERFRQDVWGLAYNPTHVAGLQVLFQAMMNQNPVINLFGGNRDFIFSQIGKYNITNLSATPTFYRLLLPAGPVFPNVRQLTSGGEKFSTTVLNQVRAIFPNAAITNVYASTEAGSLFSSRGETFYIKDEFLPWVMIDKDELLLHRTLVGQSDDIPMEGDWYRSGDMIEIISENPLQFRFLARKNEMINVGGQKVNPEEVEEVILELADIIDARVFGRKNSVTGNILYCEVVAHNPEINESSIRRMLSGRLQEYKIPRIIRFVDKIDQTRTGKKKRN